MVRYVATARPNSFSARRQEAKVPSRNGFLDGWLVTEKALTEALRDGADIDDICKALHSPQVVRAASKGSREYRVYGSVRLSVDPDEMKISQILVTARI